MSLNLEDRKKIGSALVVGGGIGGMQAALDLAESGIKVYMVDNKSSIGGVMSQLDKTFPTNDCAMCTMAPRLVEIGRHKDIEKITLSEVESITGQPGNFTVKIKKQPRYVDEEKCTGCGACVSNCPTRNTVQLQEREVITLEPQYEETVINILQKHKDRKGPLMPILQDVNEVYNYFPEKILKYISQETGYPLTHINRIATFYSAFSLKPIGKHVINVCMGTACYVRGAELLLEKFVDVLGVGIDETTEDMLFTLKSVRCIGCCGLAPVATIGDDVYGKLQSKDIPDIIAKYQKKEQ
ncbi:MAG: NAD(P)H-dependent oxidoreductase subunit E [Candidatus Marinimicrobia bacterium]|nr:NAD(P)H-dependent oxidoreductase subunit E [Candidatus Neomarinimicrobiota bacterium]MBL7046347.1 NAD(P)H-dependent oxidoreductase subunit E [Candidatus Neomarinimicrobiota bacterium]